MEFPVNCNYEAMRRFKIMKILDDLKKIREVTPEEIETMEKACTEYLEYKINHAELIRHVEAIIQRMLKEPK